MPSPWPVPSAPPPTQQLTQAQGQDLLHHRAQRREKAERQAECRMPLFRAQLCCQPSGDPRPVAAHLWPPAVLRAWVYKVRLPGLVEGAEQE